MAGKFESAGLNLTVKEKHKLFKKLGINSIEELEDAVLKKPPIQ